MTTDLSVRLEDLYKTKMELVRSLRKARRNIIEDTSLSTEQRDLMLDRVFEIFPSQDLDIKLISEIDDKRGASYVSSISSFIRIKKHMKKLGYNLAPGANDKTKDLLFAESLSVPIPRVFQDGIDADEIKVRPNVVVKPIVGASARGVFLVRSDLSISAVGKTEIFFNIREAFEYYNIDVNVQKFKVEELIKFEDAPANDFKVYSFYGEPALFLEIERGATGRRYCWYDATGQIIPYGTVDPSRNSRITSFSGTGLPPEVFKYQEVISRKTPAPFLRIDFLKGDKGLYLGEITPHPGRYREGLTTSINHKLGVAFENAWARLLDDLLDGKSFSLYRTIYRP